jgi:hypothetical protein
MLSPQQAMVSSVRMAHVWKAPALTALKVPEDGEDWPKPLAPQHATVPSARMAQLWNWPALIALNAGKLLAAPSSPQS